MEFPRPEYQSEWYFPSPGDLPNPRIKPRSPALQADSLPSEPPGKPELLYPPPHQILYIETSPSAPQNVTVFGYGGFKR